MPAEIKLNVHPSAQAMFDFLPNMFSERVAPIVESIEGIGSEQRSTVIIETHTLLNGRERGYCLVVSRLDGPSTSPVLLVSFAECRGSDSVFVQHILTNKKHRYQISFEGPSCSMFDDASYYKRDHFGPDEIEKAAEEVTEVVRKYLLGEIT